MQNYESHSATTAQNIQNQDSKSFLIAFVLSATCLFFLKWCIEKHIITTGFINFLALFFDNLTISAKGNCSTEIALLIIACLAAFGLYCLIRYFLAAAITLAVFAAIVFFFYSDAQSEHIKPFKLKTNEAVERNYAPFGG